MANSTAARNTLFLGFGGHNFNYPYVKSSIMLQERGFEYSGIILAKVLMSRTGNTLLLISIVLRLREKTGGNFDGNY